MKFKSLVGICCISLSTALSPCFISAQGSVKNVVKGEEDWRYLKMAENAFVSGDLGKAISCAETAKQNRKQNNDWKIYTLENTLRLADVRRAGDLIEDVVPVLLSHNQTDAVNILRTVQTGKNGDSFKGSFSAILAYLAEDYYYPEADYLMGKVYRLEGETDLAFEYMNSAYEHADKLDVYDVRFDILYDLADLSYDTEKESDYEKYLLSVLKDDNVYRDDGLYKAMNRIITENKPESVEKFFLLYRCENYHSLQALEGLSVYYLTRGEKEKALRCSSMASIIAVTKITSSLKSRLTDYSYVSLEDTLNRVASQTDIVSWGNNNGIWELYYNFASICYATGNTRFAGELFAVLSRSEPVEYWRTLSYRRLAGL